METSRVFTTFTGVASCTQLIHGQSQGFVSFFTDCAKRHGSGDEVFHYVFYRFYLVDMNRVLLECEEVAQEYRTVFFVNLMRKFLELSIIPGACSQLQSSYCFRIPSMFLSVFAEREQTYMRKQRFYFIRFEAGIVECYVVFGYLVKTDTAYGRYVCAEISFQKFFAQSYSLEYLCASV